MKKNCRSFKKENEKDKKGKKKEGESSGKDKVNTIRDDSGSEEGDILFVSKVKPSVLVATSDITVQDWIMDSGASFHVTPHCEWFTRYDAKRTGRVRLGNNFACDIKGIGNIKLKFQSGATFLLKDVRHVPNLTKSLISTGQLDDEGYTCIYGETLGRFPRDHSR